MRDSRSLIDKVTAPPEDEMEAIRQHLCELLNTTVGGSACSPDFGTIDHIHPVHDWDHTVKDLRRSIQRAIEGNEHRLSHVRVSQVEVPQDPQVLIFRIRGRLSSGRSVDLELKNDPRLAGRVDYWMI